MDVICEGVDVNPVDTIVVLLTHPKHEVCKEVGAEPNVQLILYGQQNKTRMLRLSFHHLN